MHYKYTFNTSQHDLFIGTNLEGVNMTPPAFSVARWDLSG